MIELGPFVNNFETECQLFIQHLVLDNGCCISRSVGRTKTNLVTSNSLYFFYNTKNSFTKKHVTYIEKIPKKKKKKAEKPPEADLKTFLKNKKKKKSFKLLLLEFYKVLGNRGYLGQTSKNI